VLTLTLAAAASWMAAASACVPSPPRSAAFSRRSAADVACQCRAPSSPRAMAFDSSDLPDSGFDLSCELLCRRVPVIWRRMSLELMASFHRPAISRSASNGALGRYAVPGTDLLSCRCFPHLDRNHRPRTKRRMRHLTSAGAATARLSAPSRAAKSAARLERARRSTQASSPRSMSSAALRLATRCCTALRPDDRCMVIDWSEEREHRQLQHVVTTLKDRFDSNIQPAEPSMTLAVADRETAK